MSLITKTDRNAPGALAAELASAKATFEAARNSVVERGVQRINEISALQAELDKEQKDLGAVVNDANVK